MREYYHDFGSLLQQFYNILVVKYEPGMVEAFLRNCDVWFDDDIPKHIEGRVRNCILKAVAKVAGPGEIPITQVVVKLIYDIKMWTPGERTWERKGTDEYMIQLDRQLRGHIMAVSRSVEQGICRFARAQFRHLAAGWIQKLPSGAAPENDLRQIKHELAQIFQPVMLEEDQLPPAIQDIEIATPDDAE